MGWSPSVYLTICTSQVGVLLKMAKHRITETMPYCSPGTLLLDPHLLNGFNKSLVNRCCMYKNDHLSILSLTAQVPRYKAARPPTWHTSWKPCLSRHSPASSVTGRSRSTAVPFNLQKHVHSFQLHCTAITNSVSLHFKNDNAHKKYI